MPGVNLTCLHDSRGSNLLRAETRRGFKLESGAMRCEERIRSQLKPRNFVCREADVFRSDVVGSLLRPSYLKEARERHEAGQLSETEFKRIEDRSVDEAIALEEGAGVDVISDGEMRRYAFFGHLIDAVEGFDKQGGWAIPFRNEKGEELVLKRPVVVSKLRRKRPMCAEEFTYLRARTGL